ncbi:hypothetical protein M8C21_005810 [Ambrosia artemisiifolia]|uniref:Rapid ALkalinization Factor n=1 Tax=Ambrosia artemisiifolia TaxID=4212 RepID=A0AAD5GJJ8_AMBAR|nr:hypothetical protein M8C21_005810 [Ambrosia artemisiifolia]
MSMTSTLILHTHVTLCLILLTLTRASRADVAIVDTTNELSLHRYADELDWPTFSTSMYDDIESIGMENDEDIMTADGRRALLWKRMRYYISYGALAANRVPCPPRSGRSYYTHDCWRARGPPRPYTRGCSAITRCRR